MANIKIIPARNTQPAILRVAAYCRVSSDSSDQLHSYAAQIRTYTEMIQQHENWVLVDIYADAGLTGTKTDKREAFNRMMDDCRKGKIDRILVKGALIHVSYLESITDLGVDPKFDRRMRRPGTGCRVCGSVGTMVICGTCLRSGKRHVGAGDR